MIRRSTLVVLTCLGALGLPATFAMRAMAEAPILMAQASDEVASNVLSIGSRWRAVRLLQDRLTETGYYDGPMDGIYGVATRRAVLAFQEDQGFEPTGRLEESTWEALEAYDAEAAAQTPPGSDLATEPTAPSSGDASPDETPIAAEPAAAESGLSATGKLLGLGIGIAALLASFGVGFFMANRGKTEAEDELVDGDEWGEAGVVDPGSSTGNDATPTARGNGVSSFSPTADLSPIADFSPTMSPSNGGAQDEVSAASSDIASDIAKVVAASSGQLGGTAPMAQSDVFEGLLKDLKNPDPHQRRKVIWELGQRGNSLAVQPLVDAMLNADSKEKSLVLAALSEIGMRSLRPMNRALAIALQDDNPDVRKNAIRDLTRIYELVVQISQMLGHAQEDEDPEVRQTASWALEQLNRIRQSQDIDSNMRSLPTTNVPKTSRFAL